MGACVVVEKSEDLKELFLPGEEIVTYSDLGDCEQKIENLLREPDDAARIGKNGQARTISDHTYEQRVGTLLSILESARFL